MRLPTIVHLFLILVASIGAHVPTKSDAETAKQRYERAMQSLGSDASLTMSQLVPLCSEGYGRACNKAGYLTQKGTGAKRDLSQAKTYYLIAIEAGHLKSFISLGKLHLEIGENAEAIEAFEQAADAGLVKGTAILAWAHAAKRLGRLSDPESGWNTLKQLAQTGQRDAEILLLDVVSRTKNKTADIDAIVKAVHVRWRNDDAKAAEALSRYFRIIGHRRGTLAVRSALLETHGLRDKVRIEEGLYLAAAQHPGNFWSLSEKMVRSAPKAMFSRALVVSAKIDKNAYVRIIQKELGALGYPVGRPSPYMNRPLIRSINAFCRDHLKSHTCRYGPLKSTTIKAVAAKLAAIRSAG